MQEKIKVLVPYVNEVVEFVSVGKGAYPYDCGAKNEYPDSVIYRDNSGTYLGGWVPSHDLQIVPEGVFVFWTQLEGYRPRLQDAMKK